MVEALHINSEATATVLSPEVIQNWDVQVVDHTSPLAQEHLACADKWFYHYYGVDLQKNGDSAHVAIRPEDKSLKDAWDNNPNVRYVIITDRSTGKFLAGTRVIFAQQNEDSQWVVDVSKYCAGMENRVHPYTISIGRYTVNHDALDPSIKEALEIELVRTSFQTILDRFGTAEDGQPREVIALLNKFTRTYFEQAGLVVGQIWEGDLDVRSKVVRRLQTLFPKYWLRQKPFPVQFGNAILPREQLGQCSTPTVDRPFIDCTGTENNSAMRLLKESKTPTLTEIGHQVTTEQEALLRLHELSSDHDLTHYALQDLEKYFTPQERDAVMVKIHGQMISLSSWLQQYKSFSPKSIESLQNSAFTELDGHIYRMLPKEIEILLSVRASISPKGEHASQSIAEQLNKILELSRQQHTLLMGGLSVGQEILYTITSKLPIWDKVILCDPSTEHPTNRNRRQVQTTDLGNLKVIRTAQQIRALHPWIGVEIHPEGITPFNVEPLVRRSTYIVDAMDKTEMKMALRAASKKLATKKKPIHLFMGTDLDTISPIEYEQYEGDMDKKSLFPSVKDTDLFQLLQEARLCERQLITKIKKGEQPSQEDMLRARQLFIQTAKAIVGEKLVPATFLGTLETLFQGQITTLPQPITAVKRTAIAVCEQMERALMGEKVPRLQVARMTMRVVRK